MVEYNRYPALDAHNNFPPPIRTALANSPELKEGVRVEAAKTSGYKASLVLNPNEYDIFPESTVKDSTVGLQKAIDTMETFGIGHLELPSYNLLINGTVRIRKPLHMTGAYGSNEVSGKPYSRPGGSAFITNGGVAGTYMFDIAPEAFGIGESEIVLPEHGGGRILGFKMEGLYFYGGASADKIDRGAIRMGSVHTEIALIDLKFMNFKRSALRFNGVYDGTIRGLTVITCGTASTPAVDFQNNTNALHVYGMHIESCEFPLRLGPGSRHNQFMGGKIEMYTYGPTASPIQVLSSYENVFSGVQFVQRNADDLYFYPGGVDVQPPMILCDGPESRTTFDSCMFTTQPYHTETRPNLGARWIKSIQGYIQIQGGIMETCWGGSGAKAIQLGKRGIMLGVHLRSRIHNNTRNLIEMGSDCIVDNCMIDAVDETTAVANGILITATGEGNTWGAGNKIRATVKDYIQATGRQNFHEMENRVVEIPVGTTIPNLGWISRGNSRTFSSWNSAGAPIVWDSFVADKRFIGDEITIGFYDSLVTIKHGTAWKLKNKLDVTPATGSFIHFRYNGTAFEEMWRNF